jgi:hypothetical protein
MPFSETVKVMLYATSGNRCAFPDCPINLVFSLKEAHRVVNFGKAAHIVAESAKGPRGWSTLSLAERNSYENGIVFCTNHHNDVTDKFPDRFSVQKLLQWKKLHIEKYATQRSAKRSLVLERYAEYIDGWAERARLDTWWTWTAPVLRFGSHAMSEAVYEAYLDLCTWLATRVWPGKLKDLEAAFDNFREVARDLIYVFGKHASADRAGRILRTEKFYEQFNGFPVQQEKAIAQFNFHTALLGDLVLELTRAANLICDRVRESVDAQFRVEEGRLIVEIGMYTDSGYHRLVPQYSARGLGPKPYPALEKFMKIRERRDFHFGHGVKKRYLTDD